MRRESMPRLLSLLPLWLLLAVFPVLPGFVSAQAPADEAPLPELSIAAEHPFLEDLSTWQQHLTQPEGQPVDKSVRGVFPVGDGHVFGYAGLGRRANTVQALSGPSYQTAEVWAPKGHWGELTIDVIENGQPVALPQQRLWRTRGVNVVLTEDATDDAGTLSLYTANFANAPDRCFYRWVELRNRGQAARTLALRVTWERGSAGEGVLTSEYPAKGFAAELRSGREAKVAANTLTIELGELAPGQAVRVPLALRTKGAGQSFAGGASEEQLLTALQSCARSWRERLKNTSTIASDRKDIADLVEDWKVLMLTQRSEPSGAVSPMVNYRGSWIRDNTGPLLAFLRYGLHDEAAQMLRYVHDATLVSGELQNHFPLDLDVSGAEAKRKGFDWSKVRIPGTELPGWIILQHAWYFRASWDIGLIQRHWPLLVACMESFRPDANGTLPTHGDETYLHGSLFSLFPGRVPSPSYLPADAPGRRARSLSSSLIYLMSIDAMSELIEELDKVAQGEAAQNREWTSQKKGPWEKRKIDTLLQIEAAFWLEKEQHFAPFLSPITGEPHRAPFGPVNLEVQWIGYTYAIGEKNRLNTKNSILGLYKNGMRVGTTPTVGHFPGSLPGYLLYTLADLEDARRNDALEELVRLAGPAGEWAELYDPEGRPTGAYSQEWPNRLRPWESGINIDAILFALNGARYVSVPGWSKRDQRLKLRMPSGSRWVTMKKMQHDGHTYSVFLDEVFERDVEIDKSGNPVRKMRFRVHYDHVNYSLMQTEFVDLAANVGETLYIRYPKVGSPVMETTVWPVDNKELFVGNDGPGTFTPVPPQVDAAKDTLFVTAGITRTPPEGAALLDIGLPLAPEQLAEIFVQDGKPRWKRILYDVGARAASRATFKTGHFWNHPRLLEAQRQFRAEGGEILHPRFLTRFQIHGPSAVRGLGDLTESEEIEKLANFRGGEFEWFEHRIDGELLDLAALTEKRAPELAGKSYAYWITSIVVSDKAREVILKVGSDDGVRVWHEGELVLERNVHRTAAVDQDEVLLRLKEGENRLLFKVVNADGASGLYARLTDTNGLPVQLGYR